MVDVVYKIYTERGNLRKVRYVGREDVLTFLKKRGLSEDEANKQLRMLEEGKEQSITISTEVISVLKEDKK